MSRLLQRTRGPPLPDHCTNNIISPWSVTKTPYLTLMPFIVMTFPVGGAGSGSYTSSLVRISYGAS